ncbi:glycosyltransferase family 4 protein [Mesorhizobium australicum]|uniref:Glycosyltransferase involved in cell wall bisynthesis n=1 Tax=Mesorhizobium australicum TaxID=536018 RepID=A0A1X7NSV8_9HYPH|nr:glycosyltransferase family 4 protein [Mesorhizobium australicum]SMH40667.1 Glycosyltransferase involved in cell wall bisynthesis [Mesorhizobium australicum]
MIRSTSSTAMNRQQSTRAKQPMGILVSAYSCETGRGSEGEIGWRFVTHLARDHEVWVITRANLRAVHARTFETEPRPKSLHFIYFDLPWIFRFYKRGKRFFLVYYYFWQIGVGLRARRLMREQRFDVLHHLIGGMDWMPAGISLAPGPFVWGPVGSENTHPLIFADLPLASRVKDRSRRAIRWVLRGFDPFLRFTASRASVILSQTPETMPRRYKQRMRPFEQTGIADLPSLARPKSDFERGERLQIVFAGELKDWKGAWFACAAALKFFENDAHSDLIVVGDGPLRADLESMALRHPQGHRVRFLGEIAMDQLIEVLRSGDVFLYPSFHHGMATVVLQAMLTGLPVVCIEGDAIGRAIKQEAGITVTLSPDSDPVDGIVSALSELAKDDARRQRLAKSAQTIARERFSYETLSAALSKIYKEIVSVDVVRAR